MSVNLTKRPAPRPVVIIDIAAADRLLFVRR